MSNIVQIDGDYLLHAYAFIAQHTYYDCYSISNADTRTLLCECSSWDEVKEKGYHIANMVEVEKRIEIKDFEIARKGFDDVMEAILKECGTCTYNLFLSGGTNFRSEVATLKPYKWARNEELCEIFGRQYNPKPHYYQHLRQHMERNWEATTVGGMEADDAMVTAHAKNIQHSIIATVDKDLDQIHGRHFDISDKWKKYVVTKKDAKLFLYSQILAGDSTDGIPGIYRLGLKGAMKYLADCKNERELFTKAADRWIEYALKIGGTVEDGKDMMLETIKLVYMLRSEDIAHEHSKFYRFMKRYERDKRNERTKAN